MSVQYHTSADGTRNICTAEIQCRLEGGHVSRAEMVQEQQGGKTGGDAYSDVSDQLKNYNDVHYRVYLSPRTGEPAVVCVQDFDYYDYDGSRFLEPKAYMNEEEANIAATDFNDQGAPKSMRAALSKSETIRRTQLDKTGSDAFSDVMTQLKDYDDVHYRVYLSPHTNEPRTVCVQSFDYYNYEGSRFLEPKAYLNEYEAKYAVRNFQS